MSDPIEVKVTVRTSEANGHRHERFFEEGAIAAGTYKTTETKDHAHFLVVEEDLDPGESATVTTSPPDGDESGHQHTMRVRAVAEGESASRDLTAIETKAVGGHIIETKEMVVNDVRVGVVDGYIAVWKPDDANGRFGVPDKFHRGAWLASLQEHRDRGNRQIRLKDQHGRVIGGFPIELAFEDDVGLRATGHINLETQLGQEAFALAKQRVLTDFSAGFTAVDDKVEQNQRNIFEAILWEGSIVDEPLNRGARILEVKSIVPFRDLPLSSPDRAWDQGEAIDRVRAFTNSEDKPSLEYKNAFVWCDRDHPDDFSSYRLPIADVIDGRLTAIPAAIAAAAALMDNVPEEVKSGAIRHVERYCAKMGAESPFATSDRRFFGVDEVKSMGPKDLEDALRSSGAFSKGAATILANRLAPVSETKDARYDGGQLRAMLEDLRGARGAVK